MSTREFGRNNVIIVYNKECRYSPDRFFSLYGFSTIFHKQFRVFRRNQKNLGDMFTRIEKLLFIMNFSDQIWNIEDGNEKNIDKNVKDSICETCFREADNVMNNEQERARTFIAELLKEKTE